jgi:hypothetical protein
LEQPGYNGLSSAASVGIAVDEECELAADMNAAMSHYPDVFASIMSGSEPEDDRPAPASPKPSYAQLDPVRANIAQYNAATMWWYPGAGRAERMANAYMEATPNTTDIWCGCG